VDAWVTVRAMQGAGASMVGQVALAIVVNAMPDRAGGQRVGIRVRSQHVRRPVTRCALVAALGWRSPFWINAPVIVADVSLLLNTLYLPPRPAPDGSSSLPVGFLFVIARAARPAARPIRMRRYPSRDAAAPRSECAPERTVVGAAISITFG
jgi:hypothetical protein